MEMSTKLPGLQWAIKLKKAGAADFRSLTQADVADLILIVSYQAVP